MSDEESTPRRRGRPPASASKTTPVDKKTPTRSAKKVVENKKAKAEKEPEAVAAAAPAGSDDEIEIVKTVKPKPNFKSKVPIKKEVDEDEPVAQEQPTSSRSSSRKEKKKEAETPAKPTRGGRAGAGGSDRMESGEEEEERPSRTASRSKKMDKKVVEEEEKDTERAKEKRVAASRSMKKGGKKDTIDSDEDEEEEQTDKRSTSRSARKGKNGGVETSDDEEQEEEVVDKRKKARPAARKGKKAVDSEEDEEEEVEAPVKAKKLAPRSPRKGKKAVDSEEDEEEEEEPVKAKKPAPRSPRKGKKAVSESEEEEEEEEELPKKSKRTASRSTPPPRKAKKAVSESEEEEDEEEEEQEEEELPKKGKRTASRSTPPPRKGKKAVSESEESEEEEEQPKKSKRTASRSTPRKGKKAVSESEEESEEEEEEEMTVAQSKKGKRTASRVTPPPRKSKKAASESEESEEEEVMDEEPEERPAARPARKRKEDHVWSDIEDEEPKNGKRTARSARKGKKKVDSDEEEEEMDMDEEPAKNKKKPATRRGKRMAESEEEDDEEEEEMESHKKRAKVTIPAKKGSKDEGPTHSRARARINLDGELDREAEKAVKKDVDKMTDKMKKVAVVKKANPLRPLETPRKKTQEERKQERAARRAERGDDDVQILEEEDVKPLIRFKPSFVNDLDLEPPKRASSENDDEEQLSDDDIAIAGIVGVHAASDVMLTKDTKKACEALCYNIRNALKSVFISKDDRAFENAVRNIVKAQQMAYEREDYEYASRAFYDEIEYQLTNMMRKDANETKHDVEGKLRVMKVLAKAAISEFTNIDDDQYSSFWVQTHYLLNKFATASDAHIRASFCTWVGNLLTYSKECHKKEWGKCTIDELEEEHSQRLKNARERQTEEERAADDGIDMDRRLLDGHILKLAERKRLYSALYTSLKHYDAAVRMAAIRGLSVIQDDPIPAQGFEEAVKHSPKDLIMRQLMDVHRDVRSVAVNELRPKSDQQIECLLNTAMQEKHEAVRIAAFTQLGRLKMAQFNVQQRHTLLGMLRDNMMGKYIERGLLHSWMYEMVTGQNPRPMVNPDERCDEVGGKKKRGGKAYVPEAWTMAPLRIITHLDCIDHKEDVLEVLKRGSIIARKECGLDKVAVSRWITQVIEDSEKAGQGIIYNTEFRHLLDRRYNDASRAVVILYWLHCFQFVEKNRKDEGDRYQGISHLAPSMADLHTLIIDLLDDERERIAPRKKMAERGDIDVTHPACQPTAPSLQSVVTLLLTAFRYLEHGDTDAMKEWHTLLFTLSRGAHCDVSPAMWEVIMHDLLLYHAKEAERDDLIYEVASGMGFNFENVVTGGGEGDKSPKRASKSPTKKGGIDGASTPTSSNEKRKDDDGLEAKRIVLERPNCLGMLHGSLKTAFFDATSDSFNIVFRAEMDAYLPIADNGLNALCLECIGMFGPYSEEVGQRYIGFVMDNLTKPDPDADDDVEVVSEDGGSKDDEGGKKRRKARLDHIDQDELEVEYKRRRNEDRAKREAEERSRKGGRNHCVGAAMTVMADLIIAHDHTEVDKWLEAASSEEKKYTRARLFAEMEALVHNPDLELAFKVAHCTCKLALNDRSLLRQLYRTAAKLQFRAFHPSSFAHPKYRSCVINFFPQFGPKSIYNQMSMVEIVMTMLKMIKDRPYDCRNIIDRGANANSAIGIVVWSCAPTALEVPPSGVRAAHTAHGSLLHKLRTYLEKFDDDARDKLPIDMNLYKAVLNAIDGCQFFRQKASFLRDMYNLLYTNMDLLKSYDKGDEGRRMAFKVTRKLDDHLDVVNEILRLNKALGVDLTDDQVSLPYEEERVKIVRELKEKVAELGRDVREVSPVKDGRESRAQSVGKTPATKKRAPKEPERVLVSTLKKEPAKSISYAARKAAEKKEEAAASAAAGGSSTSLDQATPLRSTRAHLARKLPPKVDLTTIDESDDSEEIIVD